MINNISPFGGVTTALGYSNKTSLDSVIASNIYRYLEKGGSERERVRSSPLIL